MGIKVTHFPFALKKKDVSLQILLDKIKFQLYWRLKGNQLNCAYTYHMW